MVDPEGLTSEAVVQSREILSAYEHTVYERFYHHPEARKVSAVASSLVVRKLEADEWPILTILSWMYDDQLDSAIDPEQLDQLAGNATPVGTISARNFFFTIPKSIPEIEIELQAAISSKQDDVAVVVHKYEPPKSQHSLEPEHLHLDAYALRSLRVKDVGCFTKWATDWAADKFDDFAWMGVESETSRIMEGLLARLLEAAWPGVRLNMMPWPLSRLGKFKSDEGSREDIAIRLAAADLNDKTTKHIVRAVRDIPSRHTYIANELQGLAQLRAELRKGWRSQRTRPRKRHFLLAASIRLSKDGVQREFDGGILQVSARTGTPRLYLLETKGAQTPTATANQLAEKCDALGLRGNLFRLKRSSAFVDLLCRTSRYWASFGSCTSSSQRG